MPLPPREQEINPNRLVRLRDQAEVLLDWLPLVIPASGDKIQVILFKDSGKYYTEEEWEVTGDTAIGPTVMAMSPNFRRIGNGKVLVPSRYWGFPQLL